MNAATTRKRWSLGNIVLLVLALGAFVTLISLGTWQMNRLAWKEDLIATIDARVAATPRPFAEIEQRFANDGDVDYWPVEMSGTFDHSGERHFFATHKGQSGYYVYTPMHLADGRYLLVNRGFVPFELKDVAKRLEGQVEGVVTVAGLARNPLDGKPSWLLPDNDIAKNVFYWKDLGVMAATSGVGETSQYVPFFVDAGEGANPGGLPVGGVTIINMPNSHLTYAFTWYGLAGALVAVVGVWLLRQRKP